MNHIQVYDPPMCCSTGVCGPDVDPVLPPFAGLLHRLQESGEPIRRVILGGFGVLKSGDSEPASGGCGCAPGGCCG
jgi:hypothetical protein